MRIFTFIVIFPIVLLGLTGCEDFSGSLPVPGYIEIDTYKLEHENAIGVTDVWIYADGNFIGVYELPAKFPIIAEGPTQIRVLPGIEVNGVSVTRTWYPFYKVYEQTVDFQPPQVTKINPVSKFQDWSKLAFSEGFENGHLFDKRDISDTVFTVTDEEKFADSFSGAIYLDKDHYFFESFTPELRIPKLSGAPGMYLELNYKGNISFEIGVYVNYQQSVTGVNLVRINSSEEWKKIYIDLYNTLIKYGDGVAYKIYIAAYNNSNLTKSTVYIDDFKVVQSGQ